MLDDSVDSQTRAVDAATDSPDSPRAILTGIYTREPTDNHVAIAHGYGIQVKVKHGHMVICDGIGRHRRERKYPRADRTLQRIVITGVNGFVTLDALAWCAEHGITVTMLNPDAELISHYSTTQDATGPKLLRLQVQTTGSDTGLEVSRIILTRKIGGQADNLLKLFSDSNISARLYKYAKDMQSATTADELNNLERFAAKDYFEAWAANGVAIPWDSRSLERIPSNWLSFQRRKIGATRQNTKRHAMEPVSAMLNYAYTLGAGEARTACISHGLNPTLGYFHADKPGRDSLALDVLEAVRPEIDAYLLGLLGIGNEPRKFTYRDFCEPYDYPPGTVRLVAPLTMSSGSIVRVASHSAGHRANGSEHNHGA